MRVSDIPSALLTDEGFTRKDHAVSHSYPRPGP